MSKSDYIERLKQRIRETPDSKLFLSLAEEYRKNDSIDEAIAILIDGIKKNPDFLAARLTLGRWYLLCNMFTEAKKEFLEITEAAADNIFALRGLAEAFENLGHIDDAVAAYKKILEINPSDEEAAMFINAAGIEATPIEAKEQEAATDIIPFEEIQETEKLSVEAEPAPAQADDREVIMPDMEVTEGPKVEGANKVPEQLPEQLMEAERLIAGGQYGKALRIFNDMLSTLPDNKKILQMKEELICLMKLTGKDKDSVINRLNAFLFLINERFVVQRLRRKEAVLNRLNMLLGSIKNRFVHKNENSLPENLQI